MSSKKAVAKTSEKTTSLTVRLNPKLKYGLEVLSRKQHRNLSSTVEWALNMALDSDMDGLPYLEEIWDIDEADRLVKLAIRHPELLTYDEQILWKLIKENGACWKGRYDHNNTWVWSISYEHACWDRIRKYWEVFLKVAKGEKEKSDLPSWVEKREVSDDEIPF